MTLSATSATTSTTTFAPSDTSHLTYGPGVSTTAKLQVYNDQGNPIDESTRDVTYNGFLNALAGAFEAPNEQANLKMVAAMNAVKANPSDPSLLAEYQSRLSQYTLLRNAESTVVKTYKDISSSILGNYR